MECNIENRLAIYKLALFLLEQDIGHGIYPTLPAVGICNYINRAVTSITGSIPTEGDWTFPFSIDRGVTIQEGLVNYPELFSLKPKEIYTSHFWFSLDAEGGSKRRDTLIKAIEKCQRKLEK